MIFNMAHRSLDRWSANRSGSAAASIHPEGSSSFIGYVGLEDEAGVAECHLVAVLQGMRGRDTRAERGGIAALDEDAVRRAQITHHPGAVGLAVQLAVLAGDVAGLGGLGQVDIDRPGLRVEAPDHEALAEQRDLVAGRGAVSHREEPSPDLGAGRSDGADGLGITLAVGASTSTGCRRGGLSRRRRGGGH